MRPRVDKTGSLETSFKTDQRTLMQVDRFRLEVIARHEPRHQPSKMAMAGKLITKGRDLARRHRIPAVNPVTDYKHSFMVSIDKSVWAEIHSEATMTGSSIQVLANTYLHLALAWYQEHPEEIAEAA